MGHAFGLEQAGLAALQRRLYRNPLSDLGLQIAGARLHQVFQVGPVLLQLGQKLLPCRDVPDIGDESHPSRGIRPRRLGDTVFRHHSGAITSEYLNLDVPDHPLARGKRGSHLTKKAGVLLGRRELCGMPPDELPAVFVAMYAGELIVAGQDAARLVHDADAIRRQVQEGAIPFIS